MPNSVPAPTKEVSVLITIKNPSVLAIIRSGLQNTYGNLIRISESELLEEAIALLETKTFDLTLVEYNSASITVLKVVLELAAKKGIVVLTQEPNTLTVLKGLTNPPEVLFIPDLESTSDSLLKKYLTKLAHLDKIPQLPLLNEDRYIEMQTDEIVSMVPIRYDVYVKTNQGRYVCIFKKGATLIKTDLQKYVQDGSHHLFVKKADSDQAIKDIVAELEKSAAQTTIEPAEAKKKFQASLEVVRDVVKREGFTSEAQMLAKSSVAMCLKAMESKPRLSSILSELKKKEGDYILSHSFMVGQVACALAHKIGWHSPATFFKLSLASFIHDISLNSTELAQIDSLAAAEASGKFSAPDIHALKLHPMKAADYSKQFSEIPSDLDQILAQHHERPDGTGFPRQMSGKMISPLSALFIMAHDLVHAVYDDPSVNVDDYFEAHAAEYQSGQFKKIMGHLKNPPTS
jgi:response regulator RpfG family c-di-GMP phosphodiesterase